jgi:hypothetical protein
MLLVKHGVVTQVLSHSAIDPAELDATFVVE